MVIYGLFPTSSYIMLTLGFYDIDSQRVNASVRDFFIFSPMSARKSSFPTSSATVPVLRDRVF